MCGIVGYIGREQAAPLLLRGLKKLEYRGYDSAGIAVRNDETGKIAIVKAKGRLRELGEKTDNGEAVKGTSGIGHTRWATHGEPSVTNAHPHESEGENVVLVHNGIIENYQKLKEKLLRNGYTFYSQTDTEVAVKLIDYYYKKTGTPLEAITRAMLRIEGSYAFGIMFKDYPDRIFAARKDAPLITGKDETGTFLASDVTAILDRTRSVYYIDNMELAELSQDAIHFYNIDREEISKEPVEIKWDAEAAEKGGYEHYMLKEIHEQPQAVKDTLAAYVKEGKIDFSEGGLDWKELKEVTRFYFVACGSAYHVSLVAKNVIEDLTDIPVECDVASEFRYRNPKLQEGGMVVVISQSGETADSIAALRLAKEKGLPVLSIVNVLGSTIARESDHVLYTCAGPEISVATTKAYSAQLIICYLLALEIARGQARLNAEEYEKKIQALQELPEKIQKILDDKERVQWFAAKYANAKDIFFIGRGLDYAIAMEGSLKLKEISYIHSEAYAAGELKHGTISLIEDGTLVVGILTQKKLFDKTVSNLLETRSRGAYLMGLTMYGNYATEDTVDFCVYVPKTDDDFAASLAIIPLQLFAYYVSVSKGLNVDKPRNLAKSVTVE
ncbi:MAG: glutamine--fructose-6-phosphate transaminase (isomerizing) [Lachnospiraceae bacterium]|nr:glutamine--fructose-6-phosphate transaminase (isomerizing) [Lachnospiraceae bacterium]MBF1009173.1 glutamine--fructose-6-phosphate transaminase (isomerizing) [Lachnospiraceae bacterium]MBF1011993.1 glutamine--fructose-6-phosphate transaminase (isomerizing) [Lachnospiraceae bacterium]MBF1018364.1 glutamine--fructose-6-phosphate transaminase (isomerizing) [Lachnospiraceae bacterium]MBF1029335.1 glutamine--fructose-6-phosphate transaminase (isomerizing) [Lachnospiraceae bacterium]